MKTVNKLLYWQDWGTFFGTTMVCVNWKDYKEIIAHLKKKKYKDWEEALRVKGEGEDLQTNHFSKWGYKGITYHILFLKEWNGKLKDYKILAHELVHAISFCMKDFLDPMTENEAFAYQHTYLFEQIASKLNNHYKIK